MKSMSAQYNTSNQQQPMQNTQNLQVQQPTTQGQNQLQNIVPQNQTFTPQLLNAQSKHSSRFPQDTSQSLLHQTPSQLEPTPNLPQVSTGSMPQLTTVQVDQKPAEGQQTPSEERQAEEQKQEVQSQNNNGKQGFYLTLVVGDKEIVRLFVVGSNMEGHQEGEKEVSGEKQEQSEQQNVQQNENEQKASS
jgi:hypothetical protein